MITQKEKEHLAKDKQNIYLRIISGIVLVSLFVVAILWFKTLFYILMILVGLGMLSEWCNMTSSSIHYLLIGFIIIPIPISLLIFLSTQESNRLVIMLYFCIIWSVDTFAMIGGKTFKGTKLAPKISPKKTWTGLIIGTISAGLIAVLVSLIPYYHIENYYFSNKIYLFIISCILALIAQSSDLFISYFKRKFNIKDSGHIIPGHGGVLDRFDSIILTAPVFFGINIYL
ncbi:phosphatidate cytidylyltransferase [Rickettsia typhi]|uniref:Phosphatidate cytidylyltransferase n=2 Tax=Rickettsia typhi TaxID=785 RepID=CDSA_RICTY|nr:phosphatidate cytidylyltransferase [Rickettsia typhi]Q68WV5.1 RecName: Full=Phosphatidate cytidylyltransferase; AltName: Full=CDP-DAG synthase; AltName: Full=CDP-DG synthase; AltName: Full=CDP-diacylglycerol synthase; Short=CDS; AltName: Full=CDP-diglyceride pyrophosphorylase; AltName: Full=CDP-diglyceride synthase; AltName: Full=CTP:phosphatidate cytidylyltransferase [Rickettsia typhi str. Wilmington]AAU03887.1 CDP-diacylglycerol synthase [Rickettsia typhi str. Wilmington]AFE54269.1 phosphat